MRSALFSLLIFVAILATNAKTFRYPLKRVHRNTTSQFQRRLSKSYPLKYTTEFTMNVGVGDPPQFFDLVVHTGVNDILIADAWCDNCGKPSKIRLYNGGASKTFRDLEYTYNGWDTFSGKWTADLFHLLDKTFLRPFPRGWHVPSSWVQTSEYSGILGLSLIRPGPYQTLLEFFSFFQLLDKDVVSCRFVKNSPGDGGDILFGAIDESQMRGPMEIAKVIINSRSNAEWIIELEDIIVGRRTIGGAKVRIDTGMTHIYLPHDIVQVIYQDTGAVRMADGMWAVQENWNLDVSFLIAETMFVVPKEDIPLRQFPKLGDRYVSAIQETDGEYVLGIPFIQNVYIVFDFTRGWESIGLALRK